MSQGVDPGLYSFIKAFVARRAVEKEKADQLGSAFPKCNLTQPQLATAATTGLLFNSGFAGAGAGFATSITLSFRSTLGLSALAFACVILQLPSNTAPCSMTSDGVVIFPVSLAARPNSTRSLATMSPVTTP